MQKQAPTFGRLMVMVAFALSCFGLLLFLWLAFGGPTPLQPKGYRFTTSFGEATQLAKEADVRISGVSVGKVKTLETQPDGRTKATIQLETRYSPLPKDTKAILRQKTLLGETYVELTPGNKSAGMLPEGGTLPASHVSQTVELDEIFRALDKPTRTAFQSWMQDQAVSLAGRGRDINDAIGNLAPFAQDTTRLLEILNSQAGATRQLVRNTGVVFNALSERDHQLRSLITNSNRVFDTTARRNAELSQIFHILPTFETESAATVTRLAQYARKTNPLITQLRPAARELSPTLISLSELAPDAKALFRDLDKLTVASKKGLPATTDFLNQLHPLLPEFDPVLRQLNPILQYVGAYKGELNAFFSNTVATTEAANSPTYAGPGVRVHYLRTMNPINPENLAVYPTRIGTNRPNPYTFPGASLKIKDLLTGGQGPPQYETRHCGNGVPTIVDTGVLDPISGLPLIGQTLADNIRKFAYTNFAAGTVAAPPCVQQPKFSPSTSPKSGSLTTFPQVVSALSGSTTRRRGW
ncbi:MAG: phospholipid/cholesterol/gamma-HCH transport system substrate-binding protein [Solirubrobacteraceae bacterium]|nr:phospholipid/cholesterol/gamma-HCH transport system substrate-binding protein [Solirubrobacteraceae bacterium]